MLKPGGNYFRKCFIGSVFQNYEGIIHFGSFNLESSTKYFILKILKDIDASKLAGADSLPSSLLEDTGRVIAKPKRDMYYLSITLGNLSDYLEIATLKTLLKGRSIANIEKVIHDQTSIYLPAFGILKSCKSDFHYKITSQTLAPLSQM